MRILRLACFATAFAAFCATALGDTAYKLPPREIVEILDAAPTPEAVVSPARDAMLRVEFEAYPPIAFVSQPILRLAGMRISPQTSSRQRTRRFTGIQTSGRTKPDARLNPPRRAPAP